MRYDIIVKNRQERSKLCVSEICERIAISHKRIWQKHSTALSKYTVTMSLVKEIFQPTF